MSQMLQFYSKNVDNIISTTEHTMHRLKCDGNFGNVQDFQEGHNPPAGVFLYFCLLN